MKTIINKIWLFLFCQTVIQCQLINVKCKFWCHFYLQSEMMYKKEATSSQFEQIHCICYTSTNIVRGRKCNTERYQIVSTELKKNYQLKPVNLWINHSYRWHAQFFSFNLLNSRALNRNSCFFFHLVTKNGCNCLCSRFGQTHGIYQLMHVIHCKCNRSEKNSIVFVEQTFDFIFDVAKLKNKSIFHSQILR